nr:phospholipase D-like domain-containing protein [Nocardioides halotolerans]
MARVAPDRVAIYGVENHAGTPVYVHAKACVIDDTWATIGSDNFNRRSWTHDSELSAVVFDPAGAYARDLRLALAAEHLDRSQDDLDDCADAAGMFAAYADCAAALDQWHADGRVGPRPPGRLRRLKPPELGRVKRALVLGHYLLVHDPDGRPKPLRKRDEF